MKIHRLLLEELTARLGTSRAEGERHMWHVDEGGSRINIVLDMPRDLHSPRVWVFDPRSGGESAKDFRVDTVEEVDSVVTEITQRIKPDTASS